MANEFAFGSLDIDPMTGVPLEVSPTAVAKAGRIARAVGGGVRDMIEFPGRAMREGMTTGQAVDWAAPVALGMVGTPAVPGGALGSGARFKPFTGRPEDALLAVHNTRTERLAKANEIGGLAVPSIAIVKPSQGFTSFGDISLVAGPEFVKPGRGNPVFASDVYSPRFPSLNDEGTKIFRGFTDMGNRRYSPLTLDNLVREMKGNVRGGEGGLGMYGAGAVRSAVTPQFSALGDIQAARGKIIPRDEFMKLKDATNAEAIKLSEAFEPYYKYSGRGWDHMNDFMSMLGEYSRSGLRPMMEHYPNLPPELLDRARGFLGKLRDMPTEYFEAKPQRGVRIGEFKGAVVPEAEMATVAPILERHAVNRIVPYSGGVDSEARRAALQSFRDLMFSAAPIGGGAALFGALAPGER